MVPVFSTFSARFLTNHERCAETQTLRLGLRVPLVVRNAAEGLGPADRSLFATQPRRQPRMNQPRAVRGDPEACPTLRYGGKEAAALLSFFTGSPIHRAPLTRLGTSIYHSFLGLREIVRKRGKLRSFPCSS